MAKYNDAVSVTFNDNDGRCGWRANPESGYDLYRHQRIFGVWRTRWIIFKRFWRALLWLETYAQKHVDRKPIDRKVKLWVFKAEIPE